MPNGYIYYDTYTPGLRRLALTGSSAEELLCAPQITGSMTAMTWAPDGIKLFILDTSTDSAGLFDPTVPRLTTVQTSVISPGGAYSTPSQIFFVDTFYDVLYRYTIATNTTSVVVSSGYSGPIGQLSSGIAVDPSTGNIYMLGNSTFGLMVLNSAGTLLKNYSAIYGAYYSYPNALNFQLDSVNGYLYWTDYYGIYKAPVANLSAITTVVSTSFSAPTGLGLDVANNSMFYVKGQIIYHNNLTGQAETTVLVRSTGLIGFTYSALTGNCAWMENVVVPIIYTYNCRTMSNLTVLYQEMLPSSINKIVIDPTRDDTMYLSTNSRLLRMKPDCTGVTTLLNGSAIGGGGVFTFDPINQLLYVVNSANGVVKMHVDGTNQVPLGTLSYSPMAIAVDSNITQRLWISDTNYNLYYMSATTSSSPVNMGYLSGEGKTIAVTPGWGLCSSFPVTTMSVLTKSP